jgi:hypothetical protein
MSLLVSTPFANEGKSFFTPAPAYASFSSTQTQTIAPGVAVPITYNTVDVQPVGIVQGPSPDAITVLQSGVYRILASLQCDNTVPGAQELDMFLTVGVTALPNSATRVAINQAQETVMTVEWIVPLTAGQFFAVTCASAVVGLRALAVAAAGVIPAIPSIITTVMRIA